MQKYHYWWVVQHGVTGAYLGAPEHRKKMADAATRYDSYESALQAIDDVWEPDARLRIVKMGEYV